MCPNVGPILESLCLHWSALDGLFYYGTLLEEDEEVYKTVASALGGIDDAMIAIANLPGVEVPEEFEDLVIPKDEE